LPGARTVDLTGLLDGLRDALQTGEEDDHRGPEVPPDRHRDQRRHRQRLRNTPGDDIGLLRFSGIGQDGGIGEDGAVEFGGFAGFAVEPEAGVDWVIHIFFSLAKLKKTG